MRLWPKKKAAGITLPEGATVTPNVDGSVTVNSSPAAPANGTAAPAVEKPSEDEVALAGKLQQRLTDVIGKKGTRVTAVKASGKVQYKIAFPEAITAKDIPQILADFGIEDEAKRNAIKPEGSKRVWVATAQAMQNGFGLMANGINMKDEGDVTAAIRTTAMNEPREGFESAAVKIVKGSDGKRTYTISGFAPSAKPGDFFDSHDLFEYERPLGPDGKTLGEERIKTVKGPGDKPVPVQKKGQVSVQKLGPFIIALDKADVEALPDKELPGHVVGRMLEEGATEAVKTAGEAVQERFKTTFRNPKIKVFKTGDHYEVHAPAPFGADLPKYLGAVGFSAESVSKMEKLEGNKGELDTWKVPEAALAALAGTLTEQTPEALSTAVSDALKKAGAEMFAMSSKGADGNYEIMVSLAAPLEAVVADEEARKMVTVTRGGGPVIVRVPAAEMEEVCSKPLAKPAPTKAA